MAGLSMRLLLPLLNALKRIHTLSGRSLFNAVTILRRVLEKMMQNPQVAELLRFIFLGTVVEATRVAGQKIVDTVRSFFVVKAHFKEGDFAYDWVASYIEHHNVWNESRIFQVVARDAKYRRNLIQHGNIVPTVSREDGHPDPMYEPAPEAPELFRWKGHWISVSRSGTARWGLGDDEGSGVEMVLRVWSRSRKILDEFIEEARQYYIDSDRPPRMVNPEKIDPSGSMIIADFDQDDPSCSWILNFLQSEDALKDSNKLVVSTRQSDMAWNKDPKALVKFMPTHDGRHLIRWRNVWIQATVRPSYSNGTIMLVLYTSKKEVLNDLLEEARIRYKEIAATRITIRVAERYGSWSSASTKSRRGLDTLVLPEGVKENLISDAKEFLESEHWYNLAGVPYKRGYLLHGDPGTGKSTTIHAIAGELDLQIYYISLAQSGLDDYYLASLMADTPARCIILIEDIDCAFPTPREDDDDDDDDDGHEGDLESKLNPPKSDVTLAGLLNALDGVISQEGKLVFATTNHIEHLDPALIRPGRMDVKIRYHLAVRSQLEDCFRRFFPADIYATRTSDSSEEEGDPATSLTPEEHAALARKFADAVPEHTYSIAQIQGYLLLKKNNPTGAADGIEAWVKAQVEEKMETEEAKRRKREEREKKRKLRAAQREAAAAKEAKEAKEEAKAKAKEAAKEAANEAMNEAKEAEAAHITEAQDSEGARIDSPPVEVEASTGEDAPSTA